MSISYSFGCRNRRSFCVRGAAVIVACLLLAFPVGLAAAHDQAAAVTTADRLITDAGWAKTDGNAALSYALLHEAVRIAPDNSLARWQLGQVNVGGEWLSVEEAQRRAAADPRQAKYRAVRDAWGESPQGELAVARWCRANKLGDEAQFHWASVLAVDPANKEAQRAAGVRLHDGALMTPAQIKETRKDATESKQALRSWATRVAAWMRALADKNDSPSTTALHEIRAVDDVAAIPAFEKFTLNNGLTTNEKNPAAKRLSLAFLGALKAIDDEAATNSQLRYAVLSPFDEVRAAATADLRYRPMHDYVPKLLDGLAAPVQSAYRVMNGPDGSVHYLHAIYREGPFADWSYRSERSIYQLGLPMATSNNLTTSASQANVVANVVNAPTRAVSAAGAARSARSYEQEIMAGERKVAQTNETTAALNERIFAVLTGATEQRLGSEPRAWWNWWQDYTDYYRGGERPVYETQYNSSSYVRPPVQSVATECFARGTPVWTKTGRRAIESLRVGDLVLSQNVDTGEIKYKPVLGRTLRPAGPTVKVSTSDETFRSTRGHPLWVDGVGWRMAKEVEEGAVLHALAGNGRIAGVESAANAETYNLIVADFNTYFVGASGILAHDNTPRRPTRAIVPGVSR